MTRYLGYSFLIHFSVFSLLVLRSLVFNGEPEYYAVDFMGGQSGFGQGKLEPAPAPAAPPSPGRTEDSSSETPKSNDKERVTVPAPMEKIDKSKGKPGKSEKKSEVYQSKSKGTAGGRGTSPKGRGDFQGSKTGPVGGVGTSLEIGGFGPGGGGQVRGNFPYGWYINGIYKKLWESWDRTDAGTKSCTVAFAIKKDGTVKDVKVQESSGDSLFDLVAKRAVEGAAPFPSLPPGFKDPVLRVVVRFRLQ